MKTTSPAHFTLPLAAAGALLVIAATPAAQAGQPVPLEPVTYEAPHDDHAFHTHHLALFNGYARKNSNKRKDGYKIGVEYEYQFHELLGVRGFADYEAGDLNKWLFGVGPSLHMPGCDFVLYPAIGWERKNGESDTFFRLSGEYQFHLTDVVTFSPTAGYDFARRGDGAWFVGAFIGIGF